MSKRFFGNVTIEATLDLPSYTASRALEIDGSGNVASSAVTSTELGHLTGVSANIQTQLDGKLSTTLNDAQIFVGNGSNIAVGVTPGGELSMDNAGSFTLDNASVIGKVLTGFTSGAGTVSAADTILSAIEKLDGNINALGVGGFTDDRVLRADGTGAIQDSGVTLDDTNNFTGINDLSMGGNLTVTGDLTVNGTTTTINTTDLDVTDKNITINNGGTTAGATEAGLNIEGDGGAVVGYLRVDAADNSLLEFKSPTGNEVVFDVNADVVVTLAGNLDVEAASAINQDLTTDASPTFAGLTSTSDITLNAQSDLRFADGDSSNYVALQAPGTITTNFTLTLPENAGNDGDFLQVDGSGNLSFTTVVPSGDLAETSFSGAASATNVAVTGFNFANGTTRSFEAQCFAFVDATANLYETFKLYGIQRDSDWLLSVESTGDDSLVTFSIDATGQILYSSGSYTGFSALTLKFRAETLSV